MISTLKLVTEIELLQDEGESEEPTRRTHVIPLIDGQPYISAYKSYPFEALSVYSMDLRDGEVWAFNCECGMPACARIDEPMKLIVDSSTVIWELPDEPFVDLAVDHEGAAKPRRFVFDRFQYEAVFENLISELRGIEASYGELNLHPSGNRPEKLDVAIQSERSWAEYARIRRAALGDMDSDDVEFVVKTREGLELSTSLYQFVSDISRRFLSAGVYDLPKLREALTQLGNDLRSDPCILLRQLDVHRLSACLRVEVLRFADEDDDDDAEEDPDKWPAPYWTSPDSPQRHLDFWKAVQQFGTAIVRKRQW